MNPDESTTYKVRTSEGRVHDIPQWLIKRSRILVKLAKLDISRKLQDIIVVPDPEPIDLSCIASADLFCVKRWCREYYYRITTTMTLKELEHRFFKDGMLQSLITAAKYLEIEPMQRALELYQMVMAGGDNVCSDVIHKFLARKLLSRKKPKKRSSKSLRKGIKKALPKSRLGVMSSM